MCAGQGGGRAHVPRAAATHSSAEGSTELVQCLCPCVHPPPPVLGLLHPHPILASRLLLRFLCPRFSNLPFHCLPLMFLKNTRCAPSGHAKPSISSGPWRLRVPWTGSGGQRISRACTQNSALYLRCRPNARCGATSYVVGHWSFWNRSLCLDILVEI